MVLAFATVLLSAGAADAQYFGRNKVQYRAFAFQILATEHFDIYYYPEEAEAAALTSRLAERWYARLSRFFGHELRGRQSVILYAASAHFRQTNAIEGLIGEGTGGVTEAIKRRIVLPMSGALADTDHVLGHEIVHAFQFDLTGADPRESMAGSPGILQFPLWFVEGMAEYLTLGAVDAQTAMWLRDAAVREKLPSIRDLDDPRYFPYRWGHALWAYIGARYGDRAVASLLRSAANPRTDLVGFARQLGTDPESLASAWHQAIRQSVAAVMDEQASIATEARLVVSDKTGGGRFNVGPRLSPDGREIAFFSERDRFSVDLFIADADTGKIIHRLSQTATDPHFDSLEFLSSAGAWSPDGRVLAVAAVRTGRPVLALLDARSGGVRREVPLVGLDDALNPVFAPDGRSVVFSGNRGGLIDLYRVVLDSGAIDRLTQDPFADLEPAFTPDGRSLIFVTERFSTDTETLEAGPRRLARLDLASGRVQPISGFLRGKHLSPQVSSDGRFITFIADPDGIANLYRMPIDGGPIVRLSSFLTGVAGITDSSPALSASSSTGRMAFSVFEDDGHSIYVVDEPGLVGLVPPEATRQAALLPGRSAPVGDVQGLIEDSRRGLPSPVVPVPATPYTGRLSLDALGQPTVTAGVSEFGAYVGGGMSAVFTDMLGDRVLGVAAQAGGSLADLGGQLVYLNRRHRWNWAGAIEAIPYRSGYLTLQENPVTGETLLGDVIERQTSRGAFGTIAFPFNSATRVEFSGGGRALTFTREVRVRVYDTSTGQFIEERQAKSPLAPPLRLLETSAAIVHDTAFFGATGPLFGARSRFELSQSLGSLKYTTLTLDWRRYFMPVRPLTVAIRGLHVGRYGRDSEHPQLVDFYAGYPELVRGYGLGSFSVAECSASDTNGPCGIFNTLRGSRLLVANVEVRAPLVGLLRGALDYGRVPLDVGVFMDAGVAWSSTSRPTFAGGSKGVVRSVGGFARFNAFGFLILEVAASHPFDRVGGGVQWQFGLRQGF